MNLFSTRVALLTAITVLGGCTTVLLPPNVQPVVAPSTSVAQATRRLEEVKSERAAVEAAFAASEQVCYAKFFVNNCLDAVKEKRRSKLAVLRAIEVEAEYYQRKANVEQRDREVAEAIREFEATEARMAAQPAPAPRVVPERMTPAPKPVIQERRSRAAEHAAQAQVAAPQRAASAKAFAERKARAEQRQREVAQKKAEKAAKATESAR
jgi:hypothetical protein